MTSAVVEWAPFTLKEGATETELLEAAEALQSGFLSQQEGFVRRELLRGAGREWCDLVYWESEEAVARAMERAATSPVCFRYFQLMEGADHQQPGGGVRLFVRAAEPWPASW